MKYDSYKDSKIPWIGQIPSHWGQCRLKSYNSLKGRIGWNGLRSDEFLAEGYAYLVTGQDFSGKDIKWDKCYQIEKPRYDEDPFIQLKNGDLLITKDGTIGKIATVNNLDKPACLNSGIFVMKQTKDMFEQGYLFWMLSSDLLKEFNNYTSSGTTILHLYQNVFENMPMIIPTKEEQKAISDYLDKKCSDIDKAIATHQKRIGLLNELRQNIITLSITKGMNPNVKLKASGDDCIGDIPEHWDVRKVKFLADVHGRVGFKGYTIADLVPEGDGAYTIGGKHICTNELDLSDPEYISWFKYYESPEIMVKKGDLLTAQRGSLGKSALIREDIGPATINPSLILLNNIRVSNEFLYWCFVSKVFLTNIFLLNTSTAVPMASQTQIKNIKLPVPPMEEQIAIVQRIAQELKPIDNSIALEKTSRISAEWR